MPGNEERAEPGRADPGDRPSLAGLRCLVTGATTGIGRATAEALVSRGASLIGVGRNSPRLPEAESALRASAAVGASVRFLACDLELREEIGPLVTTISRTWPQLDVLINNAGAIFRRKALTSEGIERTWALNVMAPFLLTRALVAAGVLRQGSRVVTVASAAHRFGRIDPADRTLGRTGSGWRAYCASKLAVVLLTGEWARRFGPSGVTCNAVHPGFVSTRFGHDNPFPSGWFWRASEQLFGIAPERGARTVVWAASSPDLVGVSGRYLSHLRSVSPARRAIDARLSGAVWERCEALAGPAP